MKKALYLLLCCLFAEGLWAQSNGANTLSQTTSDMHSDTVEAQFPGGNEALSKWIRENMKYPEACLNEGIEERIVVGFTVDKDGSFKDAIAHLSADARLEAEVWRLIVAMPAWTPAKRKGISVPSHVCIPVTFRLPGKEVHAEDTAFKVKYVEAKFQADGRRNASDWLNAQMKESKLCRLKGASGEVKVSVVVGSDGNVVSAKVTKSSDVTLTQEVLRLLKMMPSFTPATVDGIPARDRFEVAVKYKTDIPDKIVDFTRVDASGMDFEVQEASFPRDNEGYISWLKQNYVVPKYSVNDDKGYVVMKVIVGKKGTLSNAKVIHSTDSRFEEESMKYLEKMPDWVPAKINGVPVDSYVYLFLPFSKSVSTLLPSDFHYRMSPPVFPGGKDALVKWLRKNLNYPEKCRREGITGVVVVKYFIGEDGLVDGAQVVKERAFDRRYKDISYDAFAGEALRLVTFMPKWSPAKFGSIPVKYECTPLPISFGITIRDEDTGHYELLKR